MRVLKAIVIALGVTGGAAAGWVDAPTAKCFYCPSYRCYGPCGQCSCMQRGSGGGQCVSFSQVEGFKAHGYTLLQ